MRYLITIIDALKSQIYLYERHNDDSIFSLELIKRNHYLINPILTG